MGYDEPVPACVVGGCPPPLVTVCGGLAGCGVGGELVRAAVCAAVCFVLLCVFELVVLSAVACLLVALSRCRVVVLSSPALVVVRGCARVWWCRRLHRR
jgi:hypothetical protein